MMSQLSVINREFREANQPARAENSSFKIHCIVLTKNEADVVGYCLREAAKWADYIYVYDGASTDSTGTS